MTVAELIAKLQTYPPNLRVVYSIYSEYSLIEPDQIGTERLCPPRPDGWVHDARPDKPTELFVVFPGN